MKTEEFKQLQGRIKRYEKLQRERENIRKALSDIVDRKRGMAIIDSCGFSRVDANFGSRLYVSITKTLQSELEVIEKEMEEL